MRMRHSRVLTILAVAIGAAGAMTACGSGSDTDSPGLPGAKANLGAGVHVDSFYTPALGVSKHYVVYLPPSYATSPTRTYPVVYFLHGGPGTERSWVDDLHLDVTLDSLVAAGKPEIIAVFPDGDFSYYMTWLVSPDYATCLAKGAVGSEDAHAYCVHSMRYDTYITNDLVRHVDSLYRTIPDARHRGIAGYSMGGFGAAMLSLSHPDEFSAMASLSGADLSLLHIGSWPNVQQATTITQLQAKYAPYTGPFTERIGTDLGNWRKYDPYSLVSGLAASHAAIPAIWLVVGTSDGTTLDDNRVFNDLLVRLNVPHTYHETAGDHSIGYWLLHKGDAAAWISTQVSQ